MKQFDVVVLGAGSGGYVASIRSAQLGAKTAIIEKSHFGGTCLNSGCIPTKTLVKNAEILNYIKKAGARGIEVSDPKVDIVKAIENKNMVVNQLVMGMQGLVKSNGVEIYNGFGKVTKHKTIVIETENGSEEIGFNKLIVATGSQPFIPPVEGLDEEGILTSTELLNIQEIPKRLLIMGGGVIGCEFATIFKAFGSEVTIVEMQPKLVPNMDQDISQMLANTFKEKGIQVKISNKLGKVTKGDNGYKATLIEGEKNDTLEVDKVLVSVGRKPNTAGLEELNLELENNYIKVNDMLETSEKDIYAIGDVTGKWQLAHVASAMGVRAVENCLKEEKSMDYSIIPSCIYTLPEIGSVGLTEVQAKDQYGEILVGRFPLMASGKAFAMGEIDGGFKIIADKATNKVVGAHLFGVNATEIIAEIAAYMKMGATLEDIGDTIHAHPTVSECVMEAAHQAQGHCIHLPKW